jgi:uncharacterized protein with ParB-like and HNH nuclease domain
MAYTCRLHPLIQQDYNEAYAWYEDKKKGLGERFMQAVKNKIEQIAAHPETYSSKSNKKFREVKVDFFPYLLVYKINKPSGEIYISSLHHIKKHPGKKHRKDL